MIPNMNLSEVKTESIKADGYVMKILAVEFDNKYNALKLKCDIVEGDNAGYYQRLEERYGFWGFYIWMYVDVTDQNKRKKFKQDIDNIKKSNDGFTWNDDGENDEQTLVGNLVGVVTRQKFKYGNDGQKKSKLVKYYTLPVDDIRAKNFEIPEPDTSQIDKTEAAFTGNVVDTTAGFEEMKTDDIPF